MEILHIACGFSYSKVYNELFNELSVKGIDFRVYAPQHTYTNVDEVNSENYIYDVVLEKVINRADKFLYFTKIRKMLNSIISKFELEKITLLHAHSLFSDGAVAYEIFKRFKIPYIVAVRNTDINQYYRKAFHIRPYAHKVLLNASKVIFISESYQAKVLQNILPDKVSRLIEKKSIVVPNGVDDYWLKLNIKPKIKVDSSINLLFVGRIDANKNLENTIKAAKWIKDQGMKCNLTIVGDGPLKYELEKKYKSDFVHFKGSIHENEVLKKYYYESDILVVPSFNETFGLVYIEAMCCGTPVIYSKEQAIDGFFQDGDIGKGINPNEFKSIANSILYIIDKYNDISKNCVNSTNQFNWDRVATKYMSIYREC